jgi:DNA polymerase-3 subunit alpha
MGKKIKAEMDAQRERFVKGCAEVSAIPKIKANELFDLIDKFAGYGFNKSHAAAYALLAYQTAWLKAHHPAEAGAFDAIDPDRSGVHAAAETILSVAASAHEARESGQGGLFGGEDTPHAEVRIPPHEPWSTATRMAQEKDAFGFYFSAHPVDRYAHIAQARGARSFGGLCAQPPATNSEGRATSVMAALVEDVRWRETKRGARYVSATFSDSSGQFQASCFDEAGCKKIAELAEGGDCALLQVELERLPGEEVPRVTVRGVQSLSSAANGMRMEVWIDVADASAVPLIAALLAGNRGGRGEVRIRARADDGRIASLRLGRDFQIDAETIERLGALPGVAGVQMPAREPLRLVG